MSLAPSPHGPPRSYYDRVAAGIGIRVQDIPPRVLSASAIDPCARAASLQRVKRSHRGIADRAALRLLVAHGVDAAFLEEISALTQLDTLRMHGVTATDLAPLGRLTRLRCLIVDSATRIESLDWVAALPPTLTVLGIENARRVRHLEPLAALTQLTALAVEGSLDTRMRVASLEPLRSLRHLEALFLTALRADDRRLAPLAALPRLRLLECADTYAPGEIDALARALPDVRCSRFAR